MFAGVGAVRQQIREVQMGVYLARILSQRVRAETEYLGGGGKMSLPGHACGCLFVCGGVLGLGVLYGLAAWVLVAENLNTSL